MSTSVPLTEPPWRIGLRSARAVMPPGFVLLIFAAGVVLAYYHHAGTRAALDALAAFRVQGGYLFSGLAMMLCSGVLPFLYLRANPATAAAHPWPHLLFFMLFWAYKGVEVDGFYRVLAAWLGDSAHWTVVARKMVIDQFIYNPFVAGPIGLLLYAWKDAGFRWGPVLADVRAGRWYYRRMLPVMIAVWGLWLPGTCCIYALPLALQVPVNNLMNCFWVLLFAHLTARPSRTA